jgi:GNAT superfamily N-acetyltransferase
VVPLVRPVRSEDASPLFLLTSQFPTPPPCSEDVFSRLLEAKLQDPGACVLVAEHEGKLIGYVSGSARTAFYAGGLTAWVDEILVLPELRREGIGSQLMEAFEAWAGVLNCRSVALATRGAAPFYEHLGYATTAGYFKKYLSAPKQP